jgi:hypothetical protein
MLAHHTASLPLLVRFQYSHACISLAIVPYPNAQINALPLLNRVYLIF